MCRRRPIRADRRVGRALLWALLTRPLLPAWGADTEALNEVVVSGHKPAIEQIGTVYQLDANDIEIRGARSLDEALELLPGVNVRTGGNGSPRIDVRGYRTRHVKLLLNGVPFGNTFDGQFDPTLIPSENIARIKLTTGASSTLYGDGAIGAVINVITRQAEQGQAATTHAEYGSGDSYRVHGSYGWGNGETGVFASGGRSARDGFPLAGGFDKTTLEHGSLRANSDRERNNAYLNFYHQLTPGLELGSTFTFARGGYGAPGTVIDDDADAFANRPRWQRVDDQETLSAQVSLAWTPGGRLSDRLWAYINTLNENTNRYSDPFNPTLDDVHVRGTFNEDSDSRVVGVHNELSFEHDYGGTLKLMLEARQEHITQNCMTRDVPHLPPPPPPAPTPDPLTNATSATLDFNYLATNNYGATNSTGDNEAIARLTMTNNSSGGVDFSLQSLHTDNFFTQGGSGPPVPHMYVSRLYLLPDQDLDISAWRFVRNDASQASNGANAGGFSAPGLGDVINNYHFRTRVGWQRPGGAGGAADPLFDGETALWSFKNASLAEMLKFTATSTGGRPPAFAALELRQVDATGFWGPSEPPTGGPGGLAVFLVAPTSATALTGPKPPDPAPVINVPPAGSACGSGGDGTGGGTPTRFEEVTFGLRPFSQDRALTIASGALELSFKTWGHFDVVVGYAEHWLQRDDGSSSIDGSFSAGVSRALSPAIRLRASAARKIRMPSVQQLYDTIAGDPKLDPERAMTYEVGADYTGWRWAVLGLTVFRSDVENFIDRDPLTEEFSNNKKFRFQGAELSARANLAAGSSLDASYSYLDASDRSSRVRDELQYRPRHKVAFVASQRFGPDTLASATMQFVGGEFYFSRQGVARTRMLDPYALFNLRVTRPLFGQRVKVFIGADNLFDADYQEAYGLPQAGRFIYGGFDIKLL